MAQWYFRGRTCRELALYVSVRESVGWSVRCMSKNANSSKLNKIKMNSTKLWNRVYGLALLLSRALVLVLFFFVLVFYPTFYLLLLSSWLPLLVYSSKMSPFTCYLERINGVQNLPKTCRKPTSDLLLLFSWIFRSEKAFPHAFLLDPWFSSTANIFPRAGKVPRENEEGGSVERERDRERERERDRERERERDMCQKAST